MFTTDKSYMDKDEGIMERVERGYI